MTKFEQAMQAYTQRAQFHNAMLLDAVIQAAREEEQAKYPELTAAAQRIVEHRPTGGALRCREHGGYGFMSDCLDCKDFEARR